MRDHCFLGIARTGRLEPALDKMPAHWLEEQPVTAYHHPVVNDNRDLPAGWPRPIAQRRDCQGNRGDANNPDSALRYGWPQCGQTGLPSMRFFLQ